MALLSRIRGMYDLFPLEASRHRHITTTALEIAGLYGFEEIQTPLLETMDVFQRSVGESSDIVSKEMYTLKGRDGVDLCLRPEGTAGVMRAILEKNLPGKYFYAGPMFRHERPQKGRQRQFTQMGVEHVGEPSPLADVECIALAHQILNQLEIPPFTLEIGTLGDDSSCIPYQSALVDYFSKHALSEDSQRRLKTNPLRILDSKDPGDQALLKNAPRLADFMTREAIDFFDAVKHGLDLLEIPYVVNPYLVRGLDYYCHTTFEFKSSHLGAQNTVLAGGRYDRLSTLLGGPVLPGVGWAAGIERLSLLCPSFSKKEEMAIVIPVGEACFPQALRILQDLRESGIRSEISYKPSLKHGLKKADKLQATWAVLFGEDEQAQGLVQVRDLATGEQKEVMLDGLIPYIQNSRAGS